MSDVQFPPAPDESSTPIPESTVRELVELVRFTYPGWSGFDDAKFEDEERSFKTKAVEVARELLGADEIRRLREAGRFPELIERIGQVAHETNLLFLSVPSQGDLAILQSEDLDPNEFAQAFETLLHGPGDGPERVEAFARWADQAGLPNKWTFATYFRYLLHPGTDFFVKPEATSTFMKLLGRSETFRGAPSGDKYRLLLDVMARLGHAMAEYRPRDMLDLQSLLWVCHRVVKKQQQEAGDAAGDDKGGGPSRAKLRELFEKARETWPKEPHYAEWRERMVRFFRKIAETPPSERATREFQTWLWDENPVAAAGQGNLPLDKALADPEFREWVARATSVTLPDDPARRLEALERTFAETIQRLRGRVRKLPRLKVYRVLAACFPGELTTVADAVKMSKLQKWLIGPPDRKGVARHVAVMRYLDDVLGPVPDRLEDRVERMMFPWYLYKFYFLPQSEISGKVVEPLDVDEPETDYSTPDDSEPETEIEDDAADVPLEFAGKLPAFPELYQRLSAFGMFDEDVVRTLHAGLWAHPRRHFAVLTGLSGSGKTLLARSYARALAEASAYSGGFDPYLLTVAVQPDWADAGSLLGFVNPLRDDVYVKTPTTDFLLRAIREPEKVFTLVLDEMNLSHPERYLAPLLSSMETGGSIELHSSGTTCGGVPSRIPYPPNLVILGTVNMDETTHGLSDKVLDRALTLEFWRIRLDRYPNRGTRDLPSATEDQIFSVLQDLMASLEPARMHFGWRVVDEVLDFVSLAIGDVGMPLIDAIDRTVYAKVLPKLRGDDSPRFREALEKCESALRKHRLPQSAARVAELRVDLESSGSARFWR